MSLPTEAQLAAYARHQFACDKLIDLAKRFHGETRPDRVVLLRDTAIDLLDYVLARCVEMNELGARDQ